MGIYIDTKKVKGGLQYYAGQLCIAKGLWVKRDGVWKLDVYHLMPSDGAVGIAAARYIKAFDSQAEVFTYLQDLTTRELK